MESVVSGGYCDVHYLPIEAWCVDCKHDFCETCIGLRYRGVRVPDDLLCEDCEEKREQQNTKATSTGVTNGKSSQS